MNTLAPQPIEILPEPSAPANTVPLLEDTNAKTKRNGKIPHLPKEQRDLINHLLDEGSTYDAIIQKLAEQGVSLNKGNIHKWFHGGYQDELRHRERLALLAQSQAHLLETARVDDAPALSLAGLKLAVTQLSEQLYQLAPGSHKQSFETDTTQYLRMLNTLARMSRSLLSLQQYQDTIAKEKAAQAQKLNAKNDRQNKKDIILEEWREFFGHDLIEPAWRSKRSSSSSFSSSSPAHPHPSSPSSPTLSPTSSPTLSSSAANPHAAEIADQIPPIQNPNENPPPAHTSHSSHNPHPSPVSPVSTESAPPIQNPKSKIENPDDPPFRCTQCANCPASFSIRPLPWDCQLCPVCPVKPETS